MCKVHGALPCRGVDDTGHERVLRGAVQQGITPVFFIIIMKIKPRLRKLTPTHLIMDLTLVYFQLDLSCLVTETPPNSSHNKVVKVQPESGLVDSCEAALPLMKGTCSSMQARA